MAVEATKKGPKLRTKTGCLTCRNRRKKCDEQYPLCGRCSSSRRECIWPSRDALLDKRHGARSGKNSPERNGTLSRETTLDEPIVEVDVPKPDPPCQDALVSLQSESLSKELLRLEIEPVVYHHFVDTYYGLIINPESHFDFYDDWINDLRTLMKESKALNYAVLSNAASHLSIVDGSDGMQELSLNFYTRSIRGLADSLQTGPQDHNAILMSVMLLYLHGHLGQGTWQDIPFHLRAATRIIKLRFLHDPKFVITKPFERLAIESVLFQVFLVTTGHWSKSWKRHEYDFDVKFWLDCENLLTRSTMFPGRSTSCNSPVLGIPIPLFKLNLTIKRVCDHLKLCTPETLAHLKQDVSYWEAAIALGQERSTQQRSLCDDATFLYILIASLLVEQLEEYSRTGGPPPPLPAPSSKWQVQGIFGILKRRHDEEGWHRTFVANWPVYTVGIFISTEEDKAFLRETIERRWARSSIYMMKRYCQDLERFWSGDLTPLSLSRESSTGSGSDISEI